MNASDWIDRGATIEFEVPRNLTCAECDGGGCDLCARSGALTVRERTDPGEVVKVTLPQPSAERTDGVRDVILRIPDQGGLPQTEDVPRGLMMLRVSAAQTADASVWLHDRSGSLLPGTKDKRAPREVVLRSVVIGGLLILLFAWLLKLSGWL